MAPGHVSSQLGVEAEEQVKSAITWTEYDDETGREGGNPQDTLKKMERIDSSYRISICSPVTIYVIFSAILHAWSPHRSR